MFCTLYKKQTLEELENNLLRGGWMKTSHTDHSVCLKPAAAKRKNVINEICLLSGVDLNAPHQCGRLFLHILWWYGLSGPHSRSLLTGGFLGSLCEKNQSQARITSGSSQLQPSCYDARWMGGMQPACIVEWVQMGNLSSISKIQTLTPHRMQVLCNLVD